MVVFPGQISQYTLSSGSCKAQDPVYHGLETKPMLEKTVNVIALDTWPNQSLNLVKDTWSCHLTPSTCVIDWKSGLGLKEVMMEAR